MNKVESMLEPKNEKKQTAVKRTMVPSKEAKMLRQASEPLPIESSLKVRIILPGKKLPSPMPYFGIWNDDAEAFLKSLPREPIFDLIVSSPPYNIGKSYEKRSELSTYLQWQERIIDELIPRLKDTGSICWQVGNFVENGHIVPLDIEFAPIFKKHKLLLRNRIIWHFGHGLHTKRQVWGLWSAYESGIPYHTVKHLIPFPD